MDCEYEQHAFLKEGGVQAENLGAYYNGKWHGSG